jgi:hypothetical protein
MDTRRATGPGNPIRPAAELGTETVPVNLVELVELRYAITTRQGSGLGGLVYTLAVLGVLAVIAILAIATSSGWSILATY